MLLYTNGKKKKRGRMEYKTFFQDEKAFQQPPLIRIAEADGL